MNKSILEIDRRTCGRGSGMEDGGMNKYLKRIAWLVVVLFGWLALPAQAASFDCAKAGTKVEKLICGNAELSKLDEELGAAYKTALDSEKQSESIRQAQNQWMKERNGCDDAACLIDAYEVQIKKLSSSKSDRSTSDSGEFNVSTPASIVMDKSEHRFKLVKGNGVDVCEMYKKNLEELGSTNLTKAFGNSSLVCAREVRTEYKGIIKLPEWRKLDLWENRHLMVQVEKWSSNGCHADPFEIPKNSALEELNDPSYIDVMTRDFQERNVVGMRLGKIDIFNNGKKELVLSERFGGCGTRPEFYWFTALFVLNEKGDAIDVGKSRKLFQDTCFDPRPHEQIKSFNNGEAYDVFLYKDETYFDEWVITSGIWVYKITNSNARAICQLN